jgi:thiol-disulfide isomerase/thioredoxin
MFANGCSTTKSTSKAKDKIIITGQFTWEEWQRKAGWESYSASDYKPNSVKSDSLAKIINSRDISFMLFGGSWCDDSESEMPKIMKLMNTAGISLNKVSIYGVDHNKREPTGTAASYSIDRVPTLIVFKEGVEINRILEYPKVSWEEDIFNILK